MATPRNAKLRPKARRQRGILKEAEWIVDRYLPSTAFTSLMLDTYLLSFKDRRLRRYIMRHAVAYQNQRITKYKAEIVSKGRNSRQDGPLKQSRLEIGGQEKVIVPPCKN